MSCKISRRSFLKVSGCLMLGSAVSGLLCGAGDPAEGGAAVPTVGGLRVNYVRAFAKDYGNNFREMEIHLEIENTNDFPVYFNQENFLVHLGDMRLGINYRFSGLNKWNGSRYIQDVHLEPGECQTISYSCRLQAAELEAGLRQTDPAPWRIALLYGQQRQTFTGYLLADKYSSDFTAGPVESTAFPTVGGVPQHRSACGEVSIGRAQIDRHGQFHSRYLQHAYDLVLNTVGGQVGGGYFAGFKVSEVALLFCIKLAVIVL